MAAASPELHLPGQSDGLALALSVLRAWSQKTVCPAETDLCMSRQAARLLSQNRLLGIVGDVLLGVVHDSQVVNSIKEFRRLTAEMNGASLILMRQLNTILADIEVPVVVYKGVVLQSNLYGTPFARPSSDIDLITDPRDYGKVANALGAAGYQLNPHTDTIWWRLFLAEQQFRKGNDAQSIDLHHRVQQPGCPMPRHPERLLLMATRQTFIGSEVLTFCHEHSLLVAAMSLAKALHHREPAGRYVMDVERMLRRLSPEGWNRLREEARIMGLERTLDLAIRCAEAIFGPIGVQSRAPILEQVSDHDLQRMVLDPSEMNNWIRRRQLLLALCDSPQDVVSAWLVMAASETARIASTRPVQSGPVQSGPVQSGSAH